MAGYTNIAQDFVRKHPLISLLATVVLSSGVAFTVKGSGGNGFYVDNSGNATASGALTAKNLTSCSGLTSTATGMIVCAGGGGEVTSNEANARFVNVSGDTMSGGLLIISGGNGPLPSIQAGVLLEIAGTMSGRILHATDKLSSSGSLEAINTVRFSSGLIITPATGLSIGWSAQAAANQACNTTCVKGCVFGIDLVAGLLSCENAASDSCVCAGGQ